VEAASEALGKPADEILRWFGRQAMPLLAHQYPVFFASHHATRAFVLSVNSIIHPEVRKLYTGAGCPHFHFEDGADGALLLGYNSPRRLCALAHGFIEGAAGSSIRFACIAAIRNASLPFIRLRPRRPWAMQPDYQTLLAEHQRLTRR